MTSSTARTAIASAIATALGMALAPSAFAQVQAQAQAGATSSDQLQEVVVTAEKRTEKPTARMVTVCVRLERKCISTLRAWGLKRATCSN